MYQYSLFDCFNWNTDMPVKPGTYLVTILNREWVDGDIVSGAKPIFSKENRMCKDSYFKLSDGRWVYVTMRVFHDGVWSGYGETVLAWMNVPEPYIF